MAKRAATAKTVKAAKSVPAKPSLAERLPATTVAAQTGPSGQPPSATSLWREARNGAARARLEKSLPVVFPLPVLRHALSRPLVPPTPRLAVESYWRHHILRADRLARALAAASGQPEGWTWRLGSWRPDDRRLDPADQDLSEKGLAFSFRMPPAPFRETPYARGKGHCCICGQPVYRFGWHRDLWGAGTPNRNAAWHAACVAAWKLWTAPSDHVKELKRRQGHRCAQSGKRLLRTAEVDHRMPLYRIWREERARPWPELLGYWGLPNLQVVNRAVHADKCAAEAGERASARRAGGAEDEDRPSPPDPVRARDPLSQAGEG
ncbi:hypothetical protein SAMN02799631_00451 [Methylobacterium sp. 174MFSha1.1]|uniref:hypothetical protein n=1 Tax=Methylobacterium sp. 174MFSha1.1 TaxID=1502749 RepID=UPI0008DEF873|nr:hypothetical protein [Methylobacterium sp. 174MFSha1.1]SFU39909.1 hypothetical protein SAMN02799631_00451 [Methylobacterium sp. 174MFSha1.1]